MSRPQLDRLLITKRLLTADFMQNVKIGGLMRSTAALEEGVDFSPLHHRAGTVLTQAGRRKARGKRVISQ